MDAVPLAEPSPRPPEPPAGPTGVSPAQRVLRVVTAVEVGLAAIAVTLIFLLVLVQAGQRYLPIEGWTWTGELARYSLVWMTFVLAGVLVTRDGHIALQVVDSIPSPMIVRGIHVLADLLVAATGAGFAWACWSLIGESGHLDSPSMGMPMQWVYLLPMLGFLSTAVRALVAAVLVAKDGVPEKHGDAAGAESLTLTAGEEARA